MLDTRNVDPNKAAGTKDDYRQSRTVQTITEALVERYYAGGEKYGEFIDYAKPPKHITGEESFAEMSYNEAIDAVTYALKALETHKEQEALIRRLRKRIGTLEDLLNLLRGLIDANHSGTAE